jgi:hypothetical protein
MLQSMFYLQGDTFDAVNRAKSALKRCDLENYFCTLWFEYVDNVIWIEMKVYLMQKELDIICAEIRLILLLAGPTKN